ncbi:MAG: hypothetical protein P8164_06745 [Gammaproteobacteria bacterium]|jgi:uncharacterized membrane protein
MNHGFDNGMYPYIGGGFGFVIAIFILVILILWVLLPFAIFGLKARLNDIKTELQHTNQKLQLIANELNARQSNASGSNKGNSDHISAARD